MRGLRPNWYLLVAVVSWGLNFVAVKEVYRQLDPPQLGLLRYLAMWGELVLICIWRKESLRLPREDGLKLLYLGFVSMGVYMVVFLEGMHGSGATEGAILFQLSPVFTAILAVALGQERFSPASMAGTLVAFAGTVLVVYSPSAASQNKPAANLVVILAASLWAYCVTIMRPLLARHSPLRVLTLSMAGGLPVMLAYGLVPSLHENWGAVSSYTWLLIFHVAAISGVLAFLCFYRGVQDIGASAASLYQFLTPVSAMIFAMAIEKEAPTLYQLGGLCIVLVGVGYASRARTLANAADTANGANGRIGEWVNEEGETRTVNS